MVLINKRKGQAAIEFLMTYGWMLLVVLIVGALIFSFVDFGALLPNKVDIGGNLKAAASESFASANSGATSYAIVTFTYNGAKQVVIDAGAGNTNEIVSDINGETCPLVWLKNVDTDAAEPLAADAITLLAAASSSGAGTLPFLNSHTGVAVFDCSGINGGAGLYENDALEGRITIALQNAKTGVSTPNSGPLRLTVRE